MKSILVALILLCSASPLFAGPVFTPGSVEGEFRFDTGALAGVARGGGASIGFYLTKPEFNNGPMALNPALMNYYRVFTTNHRHGDSMRGAPSTATITAPDTLQVRWEPGEDRPFALTATYRWSAPDTLDVETLVEAKAALPDFEVFLSSYCPSNFPSARAYAKQAGGKAAFIDADPDSGAWQMFPRGAAAVKLIKDGRWNIEPNPVDWAIRPEFAAPILYRKEDRLGTVIATMTRPGDCFALSTPKSAEVHFSMYASLFGRTLAPGDTTRARSRLIVAKLSESGILERYEKFMAEFPESH